MTQAPAAVTRIPFVSKCPRCGDERAQWYSDRAVSTLLRRGHPVEGYCVMSQEYWQLDSRERSDLATKFASWPDLVRSALPASRWRFRFCTIAPETR